MYKKLYLSALIAVFFACLGFSDDARLDKEIHFPKGEKPLFVFIRSMVSQVQIPCFAEGFNGKDELDNKIEFAFEDASVRKFLDAFSAKTGYKYHIINDVLVLRKQEFVSDKNYPLAQKSFTLSVNSDDAKKEDPIKDVPLFREAFAKSVYFYNFHFEYNPPKVFHKDYKNVSLQDIIIDMLQGSEDFCYVIKKSSKEKNDFFKYIREHRPALYDLIIDKDTPLYTVIIFYAKFSISTSKKTLVLKDGRELVSCKVEVGDSGKYPFFTVTLSNDTNETFNFKDLKNKNLFLNDASSGMKDGKQYSGSMTVFPSVKENTLDEFSLSPGEKKIIKFSLGDAMFYEDAPSTITVLPEAVMKRFHLIKAEPLERFDKLEHHYSKFRVYLLFSDSKDEKYLTCSKQFLYTWQNQKLEAIRKRADEMDKKHQ